MQSVQILEQINARPQPIATPVAPNAPQAPSPDDILTFGDFQRYGQQAVAPTYQALAATNRALMQQRYPNEFARYGPQIDMLIATIPVESRSIDILENAIKIVRADHMDEIVQERAQAMVANMEPTLRSGGGGSGTATSPLPQNNPLDAEGVNPEWQRRAKEVGLTAETIRDYCKANGMSMDDYFKLLAPKSVGA